MTLDDTIRLIQDGKIQHLKIVDSEGKKVFDFNGSTVDDLISQIQQYKNILASYGRVKFVAANEAVYKQNWRDAYQWTVIFNNTKEAAPSAPQQSNNGIPSGFISQNEAQLLADLKALQMQRETDLKLAEMQKQIDNKEKDSSEGIEKYLPMLGMIMDIDEKKLSNMIALAGLQNAMNGKSTGIAGPPTEIQNAVKGTEEEKQMIEAINKQMELLSHKVQLSSICEFLKVLNEKPEFLKSLMDMAANFKKS